MRVKQKSLAKNSIENVMGRPPERSATRFRILPITLSLLGLMALNKTVDLYFGMQAIQPAVAAGAPKEGDGKDKSGEEEKTVTEGEGKTSLEDIKKLKEEQAQKQFSPLEIDILQNLKARRKELDEREKEINLKLKVLDVSDKRLNERIEEMRALQRELKITLTRYEDKQGAEIRGLVKIYESMRPTDAAVIFNELDLPILLSVVDEMSARKVAPILAAMKAERAKEVTEELAELRKLRSLKSNRAKALTNGE